MLNADDIKKYHELMVSQDLLELEVKEGDFHLRLARGRPVVAVEARPSASAAPARFPETAGAAGGSGAPDDEAGRHTVASPLAGVFYRSPSPTSAPFVKEGDKAAFGDILCIVEAMKVMNEIRADRPGLIRKILVENGKPVSAGQELFAMESIS
jgi:acetyl-CoA carboxylase biotin carboxyl carrier protein